MADARQLPTLMPPRDRANRETKKQGAATPKKITGVSKGTGW